jgi:hypothetical protein
MIPDTYPGKFLAFRRRKKTNHGITIACLVYCGTPDTVIITPFSCSGLCNLFHLFHEVVEVATTLA